MSTTASWSWVLGTACVAAVLPFVAAAVYNVWFHPLRTVPGPRLAAVTDFYAFYWNYIRGEGYSKQFDSLHRRYDSPVIRIGPNHLHTIQPKFYDIIFKVGSKWRKHNSFYRHFGGLDAMVEPHHYRAYRTHIAPLYAQRAVDGLVPKLRGDLDMSAARMLEAYRDGEAINMARVAQTLSTSMILHILFSIDIPLYDCDGHHPFLEAVEQLLKETWLFLGYPQLLAVLSLIPGTRFARLNAVWTTFTKYCTSWYQEDLRVQSTSNEHSTRDSHTKRYLAIKERDGDDGKKSIVPKPLDDVFNFVAGGADTTAYTTASAIFYILSSPTVCKTLVAELDAHSSIIRDELDYNRIQSLPYLNAVVKETLRIAVPVPGCLPRVVPEGGITLGSFSLPAGTAVSLSHQAISFNDDIFPSPHSFRPERWIGPEAAGLDKWNVAFSRGPRQCIGTSMAYLELRCTLAYFFSRFEMTLTGNCGRRLRYVDRFVAANLDDVEVRILRHRWS
uniref:Elymoclavine monooxygenase n=1 Tax=Claviceps paspali TaxID=40601 RepID=G8GV80_CLAPA|nr:elymoclavine monooxygenase [Claviceps paspali]